MAAKGKTLKDAAAEKLAGSIEVNGITVEGVTAETLDDFDFLEAIAISSDPDATDSEKLLAFTKVGPIVFGADQWKRIKRELREQNGGRLPVESVMGFIDGVLVRLNSKNS